MKTIWKISRFGSVLAISNFALSALWIAIAFDDPWHQGLLVMIDLPVGYIPFWIGDVCRWFVDSSFAGNIAVDVSFLIVGPIWYFIVGSLTSRLIQMARGQQPQAAANDLKR
jgi:hypothetical protein